MKRIILAVAAIAVVVFGAAGCNYGKTPDQNGGLTSVKLSETERALTAEQQFDLAVTPVPETAVLPETVWTSSNPEIVCVENGKVTARARGTATVKAAAGNFSAECAVTVSDTETFKTLSAGESINAAIQAIPENPDKVYTIKLLSGEYRENVVVDRCNVRLLGANSGIAANGARNPESVILPVSGLMPAGTLNADRQNIGVVALECDSAVIDGIAVNGDNPEVSTNLDSFYKGKYLSGASTDSYFGIFTRVKKLSYSNEFEVKFQNLTIQNCVVSNVFYAGVSLSARNALDASLGNKILGNRIENVCSDVYGYGIELDKNIFADITGNVIENVRTGVKLEVLNAGGGTGTISNNEIIARGEGVVFSKLSADADYLVKNNVVRSDSGLFGIAFLSCTNDGFKMLKAEGNVFEGFQVGVYVYNSNRAIDIAGGQIKDCERGFYVSDSGLKSYDGVTLNLVDVINVTCEETTFESCDTAIHVFADSRRNNSLVIKGATVRDCDTGLKAEVGNGSSAIISIVREVVYENVGSQEVVLGSGQINRS